MAVIKWHTFPGSTGILLAGHYYRLLSSSSIIMYHITFTVKSQSFPIHLRAASHSPCVKLTMHSYIHLSTNGAPVSQEMPAEIISLKC